MSIWALRLPTELAEVAVRVARTQRRGPSWLTPASGGAAMATGIVSVGLHLTAHDLTSQITLGLGAAAWVTLAAGVVLDVSRDRRAWLADAREPAALTAPAATAILGTRFLQAGRLTFGVIALVVCVLLLPVLLTDVLAARRSAGRSAEPGAFFLVCVAPQSTAVLVIGIAQAETVRWLAYVGAALFCLGLGGYLDALRRFDYRQVWTGRGDQWILAGAAAVSALTAVRLAAVAWWGHGARMAFDTAAVALLGLAYAGYLVLAVAEILRPRLAYDVRRWATVFPLVMTAVATLSASAVLGAGWLAPIGRVLLAIGVAAWIAAVIGLIRASIH
jgi:tellurite resistance protein TehA-like permease